MGTGISIINGNPFTKKMVSSQLNKGPDKMASSNGNFFLGTGPLRGEFSGYRWIPLTKASDAELWYFFWSAPEYRIE